MEITVNGQTEQIPDGETVADVLQKLECEPRHVAVEVNLELVPRSRHAECKLKPGDQIEIVTLVGGG